MSSIEETLTAQVFDDARTDPVDPFAVFEEWLAEAQAAEVNDAGAMALASMDDDGMPDVRMVLLNGRDARGFVFFTNIESAKGRQLRAHPMAAAVFHWKSLRRQVRLRGLVEEVDAEEADAYFASRPRGSQIGAHASAQSRPLESRAALIERAALLTERFDGTDVPRPAYWGGFRIAPVRIEFWKDGEYRLHDRVGFTRDGLDEPWTRTRFNP